MRKAGLGADVYVHTLKEGVPITTVSANLGHSTTSITMNVYAHYIPAQDDAVAVVLERVIGGLE